MSIRNTKAIVSGKITEVATSAALFPNALIAAKKTREQVEKRILNEFQSEVMIMRLFDADYVLHKMDTTPEWWNQLVSQLRRTNEKQRTGGKT